MQSGKMRNLFVTGTDTGVGKTLICGLLLKYLLEKGVNAVSQKWIQTGSLNFSEDVERHLSIAGTTKVNIKGRLSSVSPYNFNLPASPHLAQEESGAGPIDREKIKKSFIDLVVNYEAVIVEGVGGALVPFNRRELVIDIARDMALPVLIVCDNKLGAINHTLLTIEAIKRREMPIAGVVYNNTKDAKEDSSLIRKDNPRVIYDLTGVESLGEIKYSNDTEVLYKDFLPIGQKLLSYLEGL